MHDDEGDNNVSALIHGKPYIQKAVGSLGPSVRGKAPVFDLKSEQVIGIVSVGFSLAAVEDILNRYQITLMTVIMVSFVVSVFIAIGFANHFKKAIFGLEPEQIARLFQERNATLESVREGIIAINNDGVITTFNQAAINTLGELRREELLRREPQLRDLCLPLDLVATPKARKLAKSKNLDLATVAGTGRFGRVTEADVEQALGIAKPKKVELVPASSGEVAQPMGSVPMTGMQQAIAKNMEATLSVPVFRVTKTVATDAFDALYQKLKPDGVTVSALLAKACAIALVKTPLINAAYGSQGTIDYNDHVNVAQAVALDGGLITPTLRDADKLSLTDLSAAWKDLVGKARSGSLKPEEYQTGTFTISNLGMFDVAQFDAILPPGQGAILAIASSKVVPIPMPGAALGVGLQKQMTVTITCDHRIISGADAAAFLKDFAAAVENPQSLV